MKRYLPLFVIAIALFIIAQVGRPRHGGPIYHAGTTGQMGTSLLYDTLRHLDHSTVQRSRPISSSTRLDHVYVIVQPLSNVLTRAAAQDILAWVESGGRLILLSNQMTHVHLPLTAGQSLGNLTLHHHGHGEILTGRSIPATNAYLMNDPTAGRIIHAVLTRWEPTSIVFTEYYRNPVQSQGMLSTFPLIVRLILLQAVITAIVLILYSGRRWGNAIPVYEEIERDENEYVHALARLYMKE